MTPNPLLLSKLFLKHQPAAKTFEDAVAMEVETLKAEWAQVDDELNALAAKERGLVARKHELIDMRRELLGGDPAERSEAVAQPKHALFSNMPVVAQKEPARALLQQSTRKRRDRRARLRIRSGTTLTERRYMNHKYVDAARERGVGTVESRLIVWLTEEEYGPVYEDVRASRNGPGPVFVESEPEAVQDVGLAWSRSGGRNHNQQTRIREKTGEEERSYSGHDYVTWARREGKGTPGIGCVFLTQEEAAEVVSLCRSKNGNRTNAK